MPRQDYLIDGMSGRNARWFVAWPHPKIPRTYVQKDFDHDFAAATSFHAKAVGAGKKATLGCRNVGFPPPEKYADHDLRKTKRRVKGKVKVKQEYVLREPLEYLERMQTANVKGLWWCPFCICFRKFHREEDRYVCPCCGISHQHQHVRRYNPHAKRLYINPPRRRYGSRRRRRRSS